MGSTRNKTSRSNQREERPAKSQEEENVEDQEIVEVVAEDMTAEITEPVKLEEQVEIMTEDQAGRDSETILQEEEVALVAKLQRGLEEPELDETAEKQNGSELVEVQIPAEDPQSDQTNLGEEGTASKIPHNPVKKRKMGSTRNKTSRSNQREERPAKSQEEENVEDQEIVEVVAEDMTAEITEPVKLEEQVEIMTEDQAGRDSETILQEEEVALVAKLQRGLEEPELDETVEKQNGSELVEVQIPAEDPQSDQTNLGEEGTASKIPHNPVKKRKMGSTRNKTSRSNQREGRPEKSQEEENVEDHEVVEVVAEDMTAENPELVKLEEQVEIMTEDQAGRDSEIILQEEEVALVAKLQRGLEEPELDEPAEKRNGSELVGVQIPAEDVGESSLIGRKMGPTHHIREGLNTEEKNMETEEGVIKNELIGQVIGDPEPVEGSFIEFQMLMECKVGADNDKNEEEIDESFMSGETLTSNPAISGLQQEATLSEETLDESKENQKFPPDASSEQSYLGKQDRAEIESHTPVRKRKMGSTRSRNPQHRQGEERTEDRQEKDNIEKQEFIGEVGELMKLDNPEPLTPDTFLVEETLDHSIGVPETCAVDKEVTVVSDITSGTKILVVVEPAEIHRGAEQVEVQIAAECENIQTPIDLVALTAENQRSGGVVCVDPDISAVQLPHAVDMESNLLTASSNTTVPSKSSLSLSSPSIEDVGESKPVRRRKMGSTRRIREEINTEEENIATDEDSLGNKFIGQVIGDTEPAETSEFQMLMESKLEADNDKNKEEEIKEESDPTDHGFLFNTLTQEERIINAKDFGSESASMMNELTQPLHKPFADVLTFTSNLADDTVISSPDISGWQQEETLMEEKLDQSKESHDFPPDPQSKQSNLGEEGTASKIPLKPVKKRKMGSTRNKTPQSIQREERPVKSQEEENVEDLEFIGVVAEDMRAENTEPVKLEEQVEIMTEDQAGGHSETRVKEEEVAIFVKGTFPSSQPYKIVGEIKGLEKRKKMGSTRRTREGFRMEEDPRNPEEEVLEEEVRKEAIRDREEIRDKLQESHRPEDHQQRPSTETKNVASIKDVSGGGFEQVIPALQPGPSTKIDREKREHENKSSVTRMPKQSPGTLGHSGSRSNPYNVVIVGNSSVGKTSFVKYFQSNEFSTDHTATIGIDTSIQSLTVDGSPVTLQLWDTAGQERYHSITRQVFRKAQGLLLMYDITSSQSFFDVRYWANCIQEGAPDDVVILLLGNKADCVEPERKVQTQEGEDLAKEYNMLFMECSAATGDNVNLSMQTLARMLMQLGEKTTQDEESLMLQKKPPKKSGCC
ncbi:hypothetical protein DPEC_G00198730 [Dallia pectoralis]|uniref:Uncharacterized protein n=1 Tax=Dallia pectoralis TaxID=75939 RepID=A0ACC2G8L5_DALPE|nr:hypothetical protein DPEC_G00198730 [Dallia pectoralis]